MVWGVPFQKGGIASFEHLKCKSLGGLSVLDAPVAQDWNILAESGLQLFCAGCLSCSVLQCLV